MSHLVEVSLYDLYDNTENANPSKVRKAHLINIDTDIKFNFLPPSTLIMRTEAYGTSTYNMTIIINGVKQTPRGKKIIETITGPIRISAINPRTTNAQVFCACTDFSFACNRQNHNADALAELDFYGNRVDNLRPVYIKITDRMPRQDYTSNPCLCKHLVKFTQELKDRGIFGR